MNTTDKDRNSTRRTATANAKCTEKVETNKLSGSTQWFPILVVVVAAAIIVHFAVGVGGQGAGSALDTPTRHDIRENDPTPSASSTGNASRRAGEATLQERQEVSGDTPQDVPLAIGGDGQVLVQIQWEWGKPVSEASVHLLKNDVVIESYAADMHGRVLVDSDVIGSGVDMIVEQHGSIVHFGALMPNPSKQVHYVRRMEAISIAASCSGRAVTGEEFFLHSKNPTSHPIKGKEYHGRELGPTGFMAKMTDATGTVSFLGLPSNWSGHLSLPFGYRLTNGSSRLDLPHLVSNIHLELVEKFVVVGRVLGEGGEVLPGADIAYSVDYFDSESESKSSRSSSSSVESGDDGRFKLYLNDSYSAGLTLSLSTAKYGSRELHFEAPLEGDRFDVGDIILSEAQKVRLIIADGMGVPIEGAVVRSGSKRSELSKDDGVCGIELDLDRRSQLVIDALGYRERLIDYQHSMGDEFTVELERLNTLIVELRMPDARSPLNGTVTVESDSNLFCISEDEYGFQVELGATRYESTVTELETGEVESGRYRFELNSKGRAYTPGVQLGTTLSLSVNSGLGKQALWKGSEKLEFQGGLVVILVAGPSDPPYTYARRIFE